MFLLLLETLLLEFDQYLVIFNFSVTVSTSIGLGVNGIIK
jgi:hypothetical protein